MSSESLSDRLVIFVVDGMRRSTFISRDSNGQILTPHVLNRTCENGLFGQVKAKVSEITEIDSACDSFGTVQAF